MYYFLNKFVTWFKENWIKVGAFYLVALIIVSLLGNFSRFFAWTAGAMIVVPMAITWLYLKSIGQDK